MDAKLKSKWIEALRSGKYKQAKERLYKGRNQYCCLGVLGRCMGKSAAAMRSYLELNEIIDDDHMPFGFEAEGILVRMNDTEGKTFPEIADWIEANIPSEPANDTSPTTGLGA